MTDLYKKEIEVDDVEIPSFNTLDKQSPQESIDNSYKNESIIRKS